MNERYTLQNIREKYGVEFNPDSFNPFQRVAWWEFNNGQISQEVLENSIREIEQKITSIQDPKIIKDLEKKKGGLVAIQNRPEKVESFEVEDLWKKNFPKVDELILGLDSDTRNKLVSNVLINENPQWHPERNSLVHIKIVTSRAIDTGDRDLIQAALFHDIAKFDTLSFNAKGWPTCLGHDKKGWELSKESQNEIVSYIVLNHMKIKGWKGDTESASLNPGTKVEMFRSAPGDTDDQKAKAFWKLCVFSKMDDMSYPFDSSTLHWDNPTIENWDTQCPLKGDYKSSEFFEQKPQVPQKTPNTPYTAKQLMEKGAKGPQIGELLKRIVGLNAQEADGIISDYLSGNLTEKRKWIMTLEKWKKRG
ncbi:hypothetical protein EBU71_07555 [bacterium]|nr:hypothetical protein [Candidatus Elulimicrobium humile]